MSQQQESSVSNNNNPNKTLSNTKENQRAIELEIIKNNLARYHEQALDQLKRLIPKQEKDEELKTFPSSDIWKELKYPQFNNLEKPKVITHADASNRVDPDVSRIAPFTETRSMAEFIDVNVDRDSSLMDCMGGYGHVSMACIQRIDRRDLTLFDHISNDEKSRKDRMQIIKKNVNLYTDKFSRKRKSYITDNEQLNLKEKMTCNNVLLLDARLITEKIKQIIADFNESNAREIVLKLPINFSMASEFASYNQMRGIGMVMKCPSARIHNDNSLGMEEECIQLLVIRKLGNKFNNRNNGYQHYKNHNNYDRNKKQKNY